MGQLVYAAMVISLLSFSAKADLASDFKGLQANRKGAFDLNYLQGSLGRVAVRDNTLPPGTFQFQAAFRNPQARALATEHSFYVGNLFTTNYYELMGEYVYGNAYGSHEVVPHKLNSVVTAAHPKAATMVRNWVLEKHYLSSFPSSPLARGFSLRGISSFESELAYAKNFFDFYSGGMTQDFQFLPIYLLSKGSPIAESTSLDKARTDIALLYDRIKARLGDQHKSALGMWTLRNAIHNQLNQSVIGQIDQYMASTNDLDSEEKSTLLALQATLKAYYSITASRVGELADKAGATEIQTLARSMVGGYNIQSGLALSIAVANLRSRVRTAHELVLISTATRYLSKQLSELPDVPSKDAVMTVVNLIYSEGFLIFDNWNYFAGEINGAASVPAAVAVLNDVIDIANDTLLTAFKPSLAQWISVEPKMQNFVDNTIKSSALATASNLATKVGN